jgi:hypothetical protein
VEYLKINVSSKEFLIPMETSDVSSLTCNKTHVEEDGWEYNQSILGFDS